jgi:group I intron endonuclease
MIVYCVTNRINGKRYVGQTTRPLEERWYWHCYEAKHGSRTRLHNAIRKYGPENFILAILYTGYEFDRSLLDECERLFIKEYDTLNHKNGYNISEGGLGGCRGYKHPVSVRRKMSAIKRGKCPANLDALHASMKGNKHARGHHWSGKHAHHVTSNKEHQMHALHVRWHTKRDRVSDVCSFCIENLKRVSL